MAELSTESNTPNNQMFHFENPLVVKILLCLELSITERWKHQPLQFRHGWCS